MTWPSESVDFYAVKAISTRARPRHPFDYRLQLAAGRLAARLVGVAVLAGRRGPTSAPALAKPDHRKRYHRDLLRLGLDSRTVACCCGQNGWHPHSRHSTTYLRRMGSAHRRAAHADGRIAHRRGGAGKLVPAGGLLLAMAVSGGTLGRRLCGGAGRRRGLPISLRGQFFSGDVQPAAGFAARRRKGVARDPLAET